MINKIGGTFTSVGDFKDEGFKESTSQYSYLEVVNIWTLAWAGMARGKMWMQNIASHWNFLYSAQILHWHSPLLVLSIQSKTW